MIGRTFGRLVVTACHEPRGGGRRWECVCECGASFLASEGRLLRGEAKSCGCAKLPGIGGGKKKHGHAPGGKAPSREYMTWRSMIARCTKPSDAAFYLYGGRGITVAPEWMNFERFVSDMGLKPDGYSLERIDNNVGYSKENCRWATQLEQAQNRRTSLPVLFRGEMLTAAEIARRVGLHPNTVRQRLQRGVPVEEAIKHERIGDTGRECRAASTLR